MEILYKKQKIKIFQYRNRKYFHEEFFNFDLNKELLKIDINMLRWKNFLKGTW